jgi:hypothetical protein
MARTRTVFTPEVEAQIAAMLERGGTAESISSALTASGVRGASRATIGRRISERRGPVGSLRAKSPSFAQELAALEPPSSTPPPAPESDGDLPASDEDIKTADAGTLDRWLARAEAAGRAAATEGNLTALGAMGRLAVTLQEAKRKGTPIPKPDPNDAPDMVALGAEVAKRLHKMVDLVVGE